MRTTHSLKTPLWLSALAAPFLITVLVVAFTPLSSVRAKLVGSAPFKKLLAAMPVLQQSLNKQSPQRSQVSSELKAVGTGASITPSSALFTAPITKIASPPDGTPVAQNQLITYTVTVTNDEDADDTFDPNRLRVRDAIPANTTYEAGSLTILEQPGNGSSAWTCSYDGGNNRIECLTALGGDMRPFVVFKIEFKVRVNTNVQYATIISNTAHFLNEEQSGVGNITNSSNTTNHPVTAPADLTASKLSTPVVDPDGAGALAPVALPVVGPNVPPGSVNSGGYLRYDIPFGNSGPANADNTVITDQIPGNTAFVGALATGGAFVPGAPPPANPFTFSIVATKAANPNINLNCTVVGAPGSQAIYCRPEGNTGYLIAVAVDDNNGIPRAFNELIGDEYVKFSSGHQANLAAVAIASSMIFPAGPNPNVTTATLRFDGMNYNRLPRILVADSIGSRAEGNSTMLVVNRIGGDMTTSGALIGNLNGQLYDDAENSFSFTANVASCQLRRLLDNTFPRTFTPFDRVLPAGRTGWMKFWTVNDTALLGAQINFNPNASSSAGAFNQGHNLHHLTLTDAVTLVIPVFIPSC